ncbi:PAS domain-containing sensor histidine kinase [Salegentibacter sp. Hel_I_6]|uniref:sensor histidine kinase n=1 Tax=Salegentibacter sp. Hel_I_6 TaxID=1250278 RepID=UPI00350FEFBC
MPHFIEDWRNMTFKTYHTGVFIRIFLLIIVIGILAFSALETNYMLATASLVVLILITYEFFRFLSRRFNIIEDFFESIKYRDFSRHYLEKNKLADIQSLYQGFNTVNKVVREINSEKETQYLYLQKILELIDIGIIAYNTKNGEVLWANEAFQASLDFPSFKNISFVKSRNKELHQLLFENFYSKANTLEMPIKKETIKVLISNALFNVGEKSFKLIVLHNIEDTLNKTESEAWKKLLSVMTHEIMNSIAPISSLAGTLKFQAEMHEQNPKENSLNIEDLNAGLSSIEKRSEGLLKFAKTYRSLSKVTKIDKEQIQISELFKNLENLLKPGKDKNILLDFELKDPNLEVEADAYLLEQVLINLVLNAMEACENIPNPKVKVFAEKKFDGQVVISVTDNGPGIPEEIKDQIFVPFFTTKKEGSGIGLSLSKQIMTLHGGKIQVTSKENKGTLISLIFKWNSS